MLALISGGASALLTLPVDTLGLAQKQALNQALLASGASTRPDKMLAAISAPTVIVPSSTRNTPHTTVAIETA